MLGVKNATFVHNKFNARSMKYRRYWLPVLTLFLFSGCDKNYRMESQSMAPTISTGDIIFSDEEAYVNTSPQRWDIIVYEEPDSNRRWCSRIVGLPGEIIDLQEGELLVNGQIMKKSKNLENVRYEKLPQAYTRISYPYAVPKNSYFFISDNASDALDSRFWGAIDRQRIKGKILPP
jgi:signal peptidase I